MIKDKINRTVSHFGPNQSCYNAVNLITGSLEAHKILLGRVFVCSFQCKIRGNQSVSSAALFRTLVGLGQ